MCGFLEFFVVGIFGCFLKGIKVTTEISQKKTKKKTALKNEGQKKPWTKTEALKTKYVHKQLRPWYIPGGSSLNCTAQ